MSHALSGTVKQRVKERDLSTADVIVLDDSIYRSGIEVQVGEAARLAQEGQRHRSNRFSCLRLKQL